MTAARTLAASDLPAAAAIHAASFPDEPWDAAQLGALLAVPGTWGLAVERSGALAGVLLLRLVADEVEVLTLAVAPAARRQGLAGILLRAGLAQAQALGAARCFLEVGDDNPAALALYRAGGWRPVGRRPKYYRRGADALLMRLDLAGPEQPLHE